MANRWIDISVPLTTGMVRWPGDRSPRITKVSDLRRGDKFTVTFLEMGAHTGTHMDAPAHCLPDGATLDTMPPETSIGPARIIAIRDRHSITPRELERHRIRRGERIIFKTLNSGRCWKSEAFVEDFVSISPDAARYIAERGVRLVGVDYLSVGSMFGDGEETHRELLGAGIWIIEGLNLQRIRPGRVDLLCLPLKIMNADGAPARAFVRHRR